MSFGALFRKLGGHSKMAHHRAIWTKVWASWVYVTCMLVFFDLEHVKVKNTNMHATYTPEAQICVCFALRWAVKSVCFALRWAVKSAPNEAKWLDIWGHLVHFSKNWALTQKRLVVERNGRKFGPRGCNCNMHVDIFDLEHVRVIWGHLVHFSKNLAIIRKQLSVERNGRKLGSFSVLFSSAWLCQQS